MATDSTIGSLRAGDEVRGVFACVRKDRLKTRTGSPYLALELRDRPAACRRARSATPTCLRAGSSAATWSRSSAASSASATSWWSRSPTSAPPRRAASGAESATPEAFLPVAYRDMEELDGFLEHLAAEVYDPGYRALLDSLLADAEIRDGLAPHARARATATTPTSAGCSSTRSRSRPSPARPATCTGG